MLYFVGTPIGNLEDLTLRAQRVLREVAAIGAEDTRRTRQLLSRYGIDTPLFSFHQHNERERTEEIIARLRAGEDIAIVSDAGMPMISDAGAFLAARLSEERLPFTCVPGPSAVETALVVSGLGGGRFQFLGFMPREQKEREALCVELRRTRMTSVLFESPQRLVATLEMLATLLGERKMAVARELTKVHEEVVRGSAAELAAHFGRSEVRGECVIVISGERGERPAEEGEWNIEEMMALVERAGKVPRTTAARIVAALTGRRRREVYAQSLRGSEED